jgi:hypothetical protein
VDPGFAGSEGWRELPVAVAVAGADVEGLTSSTVDSGPLGVGVGVPDAAAAALARAAEIRSA